MTVISIVTAVWNRADTISDALRSLQAQRHQDIEHVIQDGGSTNGTLEVLCVPTDARMRPESGPYGGIPRAAGDVVKFRHSGDVLAHGNVLVRVKATFAALFIILEVSGDQT